MYQSHNPNPNGKRVGDCTVRAIAKATGQSWEETYVGLCLKGFEMGDMPSSDAVWGAYLRRNGFFRSAIPNDFPENYTVEDFCHDNPSGTYILAISGHVVCVVDGEYYDSWDSGSEIPQYFWQRRE